MRLARAKVLADACARLAILHDGWRFRLDGRGYWPGISATDWSGWVMEFPSHRLPCTVDAIVKAVSGWVEANQSDDGADDDAHPWLRK